MAVWCWTVFGSSRSLAVYATTDMAPEPRLKAEGVSDHKSSRKLKMKTSNITRSRKNALKLEHARADLEFVDRLKTNYIQQRDKQNIRN